VRTLAFEAASPVRSVLVAGRPASFTTSGTRVVVTLEPAVTVSAGSTLEVALFW
jgi:hypothetical protein